MKKSTVYDILVILGFALGLLVAAGVGYICVEKEASVYNKLCSPRVRATAMDALFAELRVDGSCKS